MFVLKHFGSEAHLKCDCGHEFWVESVAQKNLVIIGDDLVPECPECHSQDENWNKFENEVDKTKFSDTMIEDGLGLPRGTLNKE